MRALVVEDDILTSSMLCQMLSGIGFTLFDQAMTESDAVGLYEVTRPDLVVCDLSLEQGTGLGVIRRIAVLGPVAVVVITGRDDVPALDLPILFKPILERELTAAVDLAFASTSRRSS